MLYKTDIASMKEMYEHRGGISAGPIHQRADLHTACVSQQ
jgi:hypothetical protein